MCQSASQAQSVCCLPREMTCLLVFMCHPQCKHHMCLLQVRTDSYFEAKCRILQSHMLGDMLSLSNALKALALRYRLLKVHILSCFTAVDITQQLQPKSFTYPLSPLRNRMSLMHPEILLYLFPEQIMGVTLLKAEIGIKLKYCKSDVWLSVTDGLLFH